MAEVTSGTVGSLICKPIAQRNSLIKAIALKSILIGVVAGASAWLSSPFWSPSGFRDLAAEAQADLQSRHFQPLSGPLATLVDDPSYKPVATQMHKLLEKPAPDFHLQDCHGNDWSLAQELKKGPVVLVFYYGYQCNHCVSQLFGLAKDLDSFKEFGATIVALSPDPAEKTRERYVRYGAFPFAVLSDPDNRVATQFGTYTPGTEADSEGDLLHGTFLIEPSGNVIWANIGPEPFIENRTLLVQLHRARLAIAPK